MKKIVSFVVLMACSIAAMAHSGHVAEVAHEVHPYVDGDILKYVIWVLTAIVVAMFGGLLYIQFFTTDDNTSDEFGESE